MCELRGEIIIVITETRPQLCQNAIESFKKRVDILFELVICQILFFVYKGHNNFEIKLFVLLKIFKTHRI